MPKIIRCPKCQVTFPCPAEFPATCPGCGKIIRRVRRADGPAQGKIASEPGSEFLGPESVRSAKAPGENAGHRTIQVHTIGRAPELNGYDDLNEWLSNGSKTYTLETWHIGQDVSAEDARTHRDPKTGHLYVFFHIVDGKWEGDFLTRDAFEKVKRIRGEHDDAPDDGAASREGDSLSKTEALELLAEQHANARDAILAWPDTVISLYREGEERFSDAMAQEGEVEWVKQSGVTFDEWKRLNSYLFTVSFITAWYHLEGDRKNRDKLLHSASLLTSSGLRLNPGNVFFRLMDYERGWQRVLSGTRLPAHIRPVNRRSGCATVLVLVIIALTFALWPVVHA